MKCNQIAFENGIEFKVVQLHYEEDEGLRDIQIRQMRQILFEDAWLSESALDFILTTLITAIDTIGNPSSAHINLSAVGLQQIEEMGKLSEDTEVVAVITAIAATCKGTVSIDEV
ncbi:MAG: hypothetical protein NC124_08750 [Clostridium sp.]|nr:hypothetical protein [Clostridium sp.]